MASWALWNGRWSQDRKDKAPGEFLPEKYMTSSMIDEKKTLRLGPVV
jgi:hypothetical protein